jgi:hypothetical protein
MNGWGGEANKGERQIGRTGASVETPRRLSIPHDEKPLLRRWRVAVVCHVHLGQNRAHKQWQWAENWKQKGKYQSKKIKARKKKLQLRGLILAAQNNYCNSREDKASAEKVKSEKK